MLRRNDEIVCLRYEHLDEVETVAEVVLASIQRLLLYNLIDNGLVEAAPNLRSVHTVAHFLLVKCMARARRLFFLLDNEFRLTAEGALALKASGKFLVEQRILADVLQDLLSIVLFSLPALDVIARLLILQSLQYLLVLARDLNELAFTRLSIQALSSCAGSGTGSSARLQCDGINGRIERSWIYNAGRVGGEQCAPLLLQNVRHLLE